MKLDSYKTSTYAVLVIIGDCLGVGLTAIFLYNSSFNERIPDFAKHGLLGGVFIAIFWFAMAHRPQRPGP